MHIHGSTAITRLRLSGNADAKRRVVCVWNDDDYRIFYNHYYYYYYTTRFIKYIAAINVCEFAVENFDTISSDRRLRRAVPLTVCNTYIITARRLRVAFARYTYNPNIRSRHHRGRRGAKWNLAFYTRKIPCTQRGIDPLSPRCVVFRIIIL